MKPQFGVFYQVYDNKKAARFVLENFREHFPENPVVLISDGGEDFSDVAEEYNCTFHMRENIFGNAENGYDTDSYDSKRTIEWWKRQKLVCEETGMDYVMIMEDDVFVRDEFDIHAPFDLRGVRLAQPLTPMMVMEIREKAKFEAGVYGMCGGSMYNAKTLLSIYDDVVKDIEENMDRLQAEDPMQWRGLGSVDLNLTYHFKKRGYRYEAAPWLVEIREGNLLNFPVIHQYKENY